METKKMTLANVQGKLSRAEMKNVMAGCGPLTCATCASYSPLCSNTDYCMNSTGHCCKKQ